MSDDMEQDIYDDGYRSGLRMREEQLRNAIRDRDAWRERHDYILKLKTEELSLQSPRTFILLTGRPITPADVEQILANPDSVQIARMINRITRGTE